MSNSLLEDIGRGAANAFRQSNRSVGEYFVETRQYKARVEAGKGDVVADLPTGFLARRAFGGPSSTRGFNSASLAAINVAPQNNIIPLGVQRLTIMDIIAMGTTNSAAIPYPRENGFGTINGVPVAGGTFPRAQTVGEGNLKPSWDADLTTETANVRKIAITTKVPDEFISDFEGIKSYIDARMPYMVELEAEFQILYGDGLGINMRGITNTAGIQTRAYATNWATTIKKAITDVEVGAQLEVDAICFHPYDWETASLEKDAEGRFLAGGPTYVPFSSDRVVEMYTYWGKPVVITTSVTPGRPVVGAWRLGAQFFVREGIHMTSTNSNEDDFRRGLTCLRAEERGALAVYRPVAFSEVTGGPATDGPNRN